MRVGAAERQAVGLSVNMRKLRIWTFIAVAVVLFAVIWCSPEPIASIAMRKVGQLEAARDALLGVSGWRVIGGGWPSAFPRLLHQEYGVRVQRVGGCTAPRSLFARSEGY